MRTSKYKNKILIAGLLCLGMGMSSCEDYLTVLPADRITEDDFWKSENDLQNVRAAAYRQMATTDVTSRIVYWGELRSDLVELYNMQQQSILLLKDAKLMPTDGMFDWSSYYSGINMCNLVLEQGDAMTVPGQEVDPSFRQSDWRPIKSEVQALRALYYFYLVRAYRDVPYVTSAVRTDAEARARRDGATLGVNILGRLTEELEQAVLTGADNFGTANDNTGRFTKRGIQALLADMYLWRGCMLKNSLEKGDYVLTAEGDTIKDQATLNSLSQECFTKAIEHCDEILQYLQDNYLENYPNGDRRDDKYPYLTEFSRSSLTNVPDDILSAVNAASNSSEAIFQLKYDGSAVTNDMPYTYYGSSSSNSFTSGYMTGSGLLYSSATGQNFNPTRGYGATDIRMLETLNYTPTGSAKSGIHKFLVQSLTIANLQDMSEGPARTPTWNEGLRNANWPIYRLTDIMLIKAEAIARSITSTNAVSSMGESDKALAQEGFDLVNAIFERCNPALSPASTGSGSYVSDRLNDNYANDKTASQLLTLVLDERQREFIGEGKNWFDIVRQCEATYTRSEMNETALSNGDIITLSSAVRNRLRQLYSLYCPIYSEEMKINGVDQGGNLVQNPVWIRYSSDK